MSEAESIPPTAEEGNTDEGDEYPSPRILDSRRLTGANWYSRVPGAILEVAVVDDGARRAVDHWPYEARTLAEALGWPAGEYVARHGQGNACCFLSAPLDALMTATLVAEQAWVRAEAYVAELPPPSLEAQLALLRTHATEEAHRLAPVRQLVDEAKAHRVAWQWDDEQLTIGAGHGSQTWPFTALPDPHALDWRRLRNIPTALITGSNGKTTTTRLVAAMFRAAGFVTGWSSSDGVLVGSPTPNGQIETRDTGDFTGPAGARHVLQDPAVEAAVLETARGGILRRGLGTSRADVACITNISLDHLGEYGVYSLGDLAEVKAVVAAALDSRGRLVLNADDPTLLALAPSIRGDVPAVWFSTDPSNAIMSAGVAHWGDGATIHHGHLLIACDGIWHDVGPLTTMPLTVGGAARHNVQNAMTAALVAMCAGVPLGAVHSVLQRFGLDVHDNAGRLRRWSLGGITALVDYAHNPDGMRALIETAVAIPATRRLLIIGQAGNRDDAQLEALARSSWEAAPLDRVIIKEMPTDLRGRALGSVPMVLRQALRAAGAPESVLQDAPTELAAVHDALTWAREGDVLVLPIHVSKQAVEALFTVLTDNGWQAGNPLPPVADHSA
jgi:cyanophycin synthetase